MKQEFEMSEEQLQATYDLSRNQMPVIYVGTWLGTESKQEQANMLWQKMADEMGFVWDSVEASASGKKFFYATPKEKVKPKTAIELEMDKYDSLQKIVDHIEITNGGHLRTNPAFLKLKLLARDEQ